MAAADFLDQVNQTFNPLPVPPIWNMVKKAVGSQAPDPTDNEVAYDAMPMHDKATALTDSSSPYHGLAYQDLVGKPADSTINQVAPMVLSTRAARELESQGIQKAGSELRAIWDGVKPSNYLGDAAEQSPSQIQQGTDRIGLSQKIRQAFSSSIPDERAKGAFMETAKTGDGFVAKRFREPDEWDSLRSSDARARRAVKETAWANMGLSPGPTRGIVTEKNAYLLQPEMDIYPDVTEGKDFFSTLKQRGDWQQKLDQAKPDLETRIEKAMPNASSARGIADPQPENFGFDPKTGKLYMTDPGAEILELTPEQADQARKNLWVAPGAQEAIDKQITRHLLIGGPKKP